MGQLPASLAVAHRGVIGRVPMAWWHGAAAFRQTELGLLIALLAIALLAGAGGVPSPVGEGVAIVVALGVGAAVLAWPAREAIRVPASAWPLAGALPLLALAQLAPLPLALSLSLPLREPLVRALPLAGWEGGWWPLTIDPASTLWSLLSLAPPCAAFLLALRLPRHALPGLLLAIAALAMLSALLEGLQLAGGARFFIHPRAIDAGPSGFFANQNSQGDFLLIGMAACLVLAGSSSIRLPLPPPALYACAAFLALCVFLTGSRASIVLLAVPFVLHAGLVLRNRRGAVSHKVVAVLVLAPFALLAALALIASRSAPLLHVIDRFRLGADGRLYEIWPDSLALAQAAFPWGTGMGTFSHAFGMVERLEVVGPTFANRAHADWLEFVIEGGLVALVLLGGLAAMVARATWAKLRGHFDAVDGFAVSTLAIAGLHAFVDYPFRAIPMAAVLAIALAIYLQDRVEGSHA